jgi:hypothetical protein
LKVFLKIQEVVKMKYLDDAMDNHALKLEVLNLTTTPISNLLELNILQASKQPLLPIVDSN